MKFSFAGRAKVDLSGATLYRRLQQENLSLQSRIEANLTGSLVRSDSAGKNLRALVYGFIRAGQRFGYRKSGGS